MAERLLEVERPMPAGHVSGTQVPRWAVAEQVLGQVIFVLRSRRIGRTRHDSVCAGQNTYSLQDLEEGLLEPRLHDPPGAWGTTQAIPARTLAALALMGLGTAWPQRLAETGLQRSGVSTSKPRSPRNWRMWAMTWGTRKGGGGFLVDRSGRRQRWR